VKIRLHEPATDGQKVLRGTVLEAARERIRMRVDGNEHVVALGNVAEARPVLDFGGAAKQRAGGARRKTSERSARSGDGPGQAERPVRAQTHSGRARLGKGKAR
jgi:hypothetical protein